jgi:hypothetical protein
MVEQNMIETAIKQYNVTDAAIAKYNKEYMTLNVKGVEDKEGYELCHTARMEIKGKRVEVEKTRKHLKEDALEYGRAVDKEAKRITSLLEPIEDHLASQEKIVDDEKARIKAEADRKEAVRIQERVDKLYEMGLISRNGNFYLSFSNEGYVPEAIIKTCPDEEFDKIADDFYNKVNIENARIAKEKADKKAEEDRLEKIRLEQKAELERLAKIVDEQEKEKKKIQDEKDAIEAENKRISDEQKKVETEKNRKEELEKARKEAADKAVKDAEEKRLKAEKAAADKAEKDRIAAEKKAARAPDKEKLKVFIDGIIFTEPRLKTGEAKEYLADFMAGLQLLIKNLNEKVEQM